MLDSVGTVLDRLDARAGEDVLFRDAARVIRRMAEQLSTTEAELIEAEFGRYAHAVEVTKLRDHQQAWEARRATTRASSR